MNEIRVNEATIEKLLCTMCDIYALYGIAQDKNRKMSIRITNLEAAKRRLEAEISQLRNQT